MSGNGRPSPVARIAPWLGLVAALALLNAAVTFHNVWPTLGITLRGELSVEIAVLVLVLAVCAELFRPPGRFAIGLATALVAVLALGRYAEVTAPALYGRPVNLYFDAQHLPNVGAMLAKVAPPWLVALAVLALIAALAAVAAVLYACVARVGRAMRSAPARRVLGGLAASVVLVYVTGPALQWWARREAVRVDVAPIVRVGVEPAAGVAAASPPWSPRRWFSLPVSVTYARQAAFVIEALGGTSADALPIEPLAKSNLERVAGADVLLVFLESYGAVAFDAPDVAEVVAPARAALAAAVAGTGRVAASAFIESPTFGGASWLAHATLMSGVEVRTAPQYDVLLTQDRQTLPKLFAAAGYRALGWMPGLRNAWPEGAYFGFAEILGERAIDYRGPEFGWWRIPDQYALAKLDADELARDGGPRFVFFPTINTHVPFRPTPPLQADWTRLLGESPYDAAAYEESVAESPEWTNLRAGYADSLAYTYEYLAGYLQERAARDFVLVLIGDHQPAASVSGTGARWDVPVHVIARRRALVDVLIEDAGFTPGIELPPGGAPVAKMHELTTSLLRAFHAEAPPADLGSGSGGE